MCLYFIIIKVLGWFLGMKYIGDCSQKGLTIWIIVIGLLYPVMDLFCYDRSGLLILASFFMYLIMSSTFLFLSWRSNGIFVPILCSALGIAYMLFGIPAIL